MTKMMGGFGELGTARHCTKSDYSEKYSYEYLVLVFSSSLLKTVHGLRCFREGSAKATNA